MVENIAKSVGLILMESFKKLNRQKMHAPDNPLLLEINLVTSWDRQCGIATYSAFFSEELSKKARVFVTEIRKNFAFSPYFALLGYRVAHSHDIVHVQFEYGLFSNLKIGRKTLTAFASLLFYFGLALGNRSIVTTMHEPRKDVSAGRRAGFFFTRILDKLIFAVSDLIIVHTQESKQLLETVYQVDSSKLCVVPHGSYQKPKIQNKEDCKRALGLQGKTVMTIFGFVTPKKGHDLLIPLLAKLDPNVHLIVAGGPQTDSDARFLSNLKGLAEIYGVSDRVIFTGYLPDLSQILNATDLALLPYRYVTDSGVLHIIVSYKVPILTSDLPAFKEIHQQYGCIELFKSEDTQDLLMKIQNMLSFGILQSDLKRQCQEMWNKTKWSNIAERHIEIYHELLLHRDNEVYKGL
jgi:glycosyltransferase involved in cell wall biosynthesis